MFFRESRKPVQPGREEDGDAKGADAVVRAGLRTWCECGRIALPAVNMDYVRSKRCRASWAKGVATGMFWPPCCRQPGSGVFCFVLRNLLPEAGVPAPRRAERVQRREGKRKAHAPGKRSMGFFAGWGNYFPSAGVLGWQGRQPWNSGCSAFRLLWQPKQERRESLSWKAMKRLLSSLLLPLMTWQPSLELHEA